MANPRDSISAIRISNPNNAKPKAAEDESAAIAAWETLWRRTIDAYQAAENMWLQVSGLDAAHSPALPAHYEETERADAAFDALAFDLLETPAPTLTAILDKVWLATFCAERKAFCARNVWTEVLTDGRRLGALQDGEPGKGSRPDILTHFRGYFPGDHADEGAEQ